MRDAPPISLRVDFCVRRHHEAVAIRKRGNRSVAVGSQQPHSRLRVAFHGTLGRMPEWIRFTGGHYGHFGRDGSNEVGSGRRLAPVMRHLEKIRAHVRVFGDESLFDLLLSISRQQESDGAIVEPHDQ
jgi:hypothetical protein